MMVDCDMKDNKCRFYNEREKAISTTKLEK
jgi:hypothetical protein